MTDTQPDLGQALAATKPGNSVAKQSPKLLIKAEIERYRGAIAKSLPKSYEDGADRFVRSVLNTVMTDRKGDLIKCQPITIVGAALHAAQLGLEVGPLQEAYLVPYGNVCQLIVGYKGLIKLAYIGGWETDAETVREGDHFAYQYGTSGFLDHRPTHGDARGKSIEWWSMTNRADGHGRPKFRVVDREYVDKRKAKGGPTYKDWYDEMAIKTAVRAVMKTVPLSAKAEAMVLALNTDGIVRQELDAAPQDFGDAAMVDDEVVDGEIVE
jgi:recombination protein RecT